MASKIQTNHEIVDIDFFKLFGIPKYNPDSSATASTENNSDIEVNKVMGGFVPIHIKDTSFYLSGNNNRKTTNIDDAWNTKVNIILPWNVGEISDSVSVSYSRRGGGNAPWDTIAGALISEVGKAVGKEDASNNIAQMVIAKYNAESLMKTISLDFILPLTNTVDIVKNNYTDPDSFSNEVRRSLGALQGLIYPRKFGYLQPPLLGVTFGGLYRGFKAFLSEVNIRYSEEMVDIGGCMFPLKITGSLKFVNVFLYTWDIADFVSQEFTLAQHPEYLFGEGIDAKTDLTAGNNAQSFSDISSLTTNIIERVLATTAPPISKLMSSTVTDEQIKAFIDQYDLDLTIEQFRERFPGYNIEDLSTMLQNVKNLKFPFGE